MVIVWFCYVLIVMMCVVNMFVLVKIVWFDLCVSEYWLVSGVSVVV